MFDPTFAVLDFQYVGSNICSSNKSVLRDIVEIKHILLPPSEREFKGIYVVFELIESNLHQVIKAIDDLTAEHYKFFLLKRWSQI